MDDLWVHQRAIVVRGQRQRNLLIAADMGTGKSRSVVELCKDDGLIIIICPVAVGPAWEKQFALWDAGRRVYSAYSGSTKRRMEAVRGAINDIHLGRRVLIVNYDWFWRDEPLKSLLMACLSDCTRPNAIVADECHRAKSPSSRASKALHRLGKAARGARRLGLTGTPMPLGPQDIYGQARFIDSSFYGENHRAFLSQFFYTDPMYPSRVIGRKNEAEFTSRLDALAFRVKADDVLDLPEAIHETIPVVLPPDVMASYRQVEHAITVEVRGGIVNVANAPVRLLRLQQATSSYLGTDDGDRCLEPVSEKARAIEEWLSDLPQREPVAVFCRFRHDLDQMRALCSRVGREYAELSGREKTLAEWQRGERDLLAVQIQAGGVGVDLTRCGDKPCRYVAYMSLGFSLGDYEQSLARVRRPGQTSDCVRYYHLVASGTVDEAVYGALRRKADVVEAVLGHLTQGGKA
jgi:SNF2 family DNA or RNA helicase